MLSDWNPNKKRLGRYSGSMHVGIGEKQYMVLAHIEGDFESYLQQGLSDRDIVEGCIEFLNTPPPRKKYAKSTPKALYGTFRLFAHHRKYDEADKIYYAVAMATNHKKSKHFWGVGREK
jgi:hypothetical protein